MVLDFNLEAAKHRERAARAKAAMTGFAQTDRSTAASTDGDALEKVPFGSGWYHDAAVNDAGRAPRKS